ncbi:HAD family phosphatase [Candidatus Woesebacteria bacterium]|nr:HAD family phosphatase [Candidatus Woesebacteria bacterium]
MKYKAIFLDVDGTCVVHGVDNLPSVRVVDAVTQCIQMGVPVGLATSRPLRSVIAIINHLKLTSYCVISSGSQIYDPRTSQIVSEKLIPRESIAQIWEIAQKANQHVKLFDGINEVNMDQGAIPAKVMGMWFPKLEPSILLDIDEQIKQLKGVATHRMEAWEDGYDCLDITNSEASKQHGVLDVCAMLGIQTSECIGVGDGYNDFPLLLACGLKIAMGNAVPELKAVADFVAPTVREDGVATVIEKFILNG